MQQEPDDPWFARIDRCLEAIGHWERRTAAAESPEAKSRLATDDERNPSLPASAIVWSSIGSAVDHLGLAEDSLRREGGVMLRPMAFYTVTRAALVAASQAIWVMTGSADTRLRRVRLIELEENVSLGEFLKDYARDELLEEDTTSALAHQVQTKAEAIAQRCKTLRRDLKPQRGEYSVTRTLRDAAVAIDDGLNQDRWLRRAYMFEWRAASGDAHARLWPRSVRPRVDLPLVGERSRILATTGTIETYGQALGAATLATSHAIKLWDQHRLPRRDS